MCCRNMLIPSDTYKKQLNFQSLGLREMATLSVFMPILLVSMANSLKF